MNKVVEIRIEKPFCMYILIFYHYLDGEIEKKSPEEVHLYNQKTVFII